MVSDQKTFAAFSHSVISAGGEHSLKVISQRGQGGKEPGKVAVRVVDQRQAEFGVVFIGQRKGLQPHLRQIFKRGGKHGVMLAKAPAWRYSWAQTDKRRPAGFRKNLLYPARWRARNNTGETAMSSAVMDSFTIQG